MKKLITAVVAILISAGTACFACDKASATQFDAMVSQMGTKKVSGSNVTFKWGSGWNTMSKAQKDQMIHAVADSDACLQGYARNITFYSPKGKRVGVASPDIGIKVY